MKEEEQVKDLEVPPPLEEEIDPLSKKCQEVYKDLDKTKTTTLDEFRRPTEKSVQNTIKAPPPRTDLKIN